MYLSLDVFWVEKKILAKKPVYGKLLTSKVFNTRKEAEKWASDEKAKYKSAGESTKKEIDFVESTSSWRAKLFLKI